MDSFTDKEGLQPASPEEPPSQLPLDDDVVDLDADEEITEEEAERADGA